MSSREIMNGMDGKMDKNKQNSPRTIMFRDPVVENVVDKFVDRSNIGYAKYGRTLDVERRGKHKDLLGYLNDVQEELMDAVLYIQAAREEMIEQRRMNIIGQNGNDGDHYGE
jgi:hypothetical protein